MNAIEAYLLARAYTNKAIKGAGALKGAPCQIKSITSITGGHRVTFEWEDDQGETSTDTMDVMDGTDGTDGTDGVGISSITYKEEDQHGNYVYTVLLTDSNSYEITCPKGPQGATGQTGQTGATGNGIASIEKTSTVGLVDTYTITYTNGDTDTFTVTNGTTYTAGDYIKITSGEISVNREIPANNYSYEIVTKSTGGNDASVTVKKYANGTLISSTDYLYNQTGTAVNIDNYFTLQYTQGWRYTLLQASTTHSVGYSASWSYLDAVDYTEVFPTEDTSGQKIVIKSEMDTALAEKADTDMVAADFNAGTSYTAGNYCVQDGKLYKFKNNHSGAWSAADVDEVKITGELASLKSGLTNKSETITTGLFSALLVMRCVNIETISVEYATASEALTANTWAVIATVSSDYRPSTERYLTAFICDANGELLATARMNIKPNGEVSIRPSDAIASGTTVFFITAFVIG